MLAVRCWSGYNHQAIERRKGFPPCLFSRQQCWRNQQSQIRVQLLWAASALVQIVALLAVAMEESPALTGLSSPGHGDCYHAVPFLAARPMVLFLVLRVGVEDCEWKH